MSWNTNDNLLNRQFGVTSDPHAGQQCEQHQWSDRLVNVDLQSPDPVPDGPNNT